VGNEIYQKNILVSSFEKFLYLISCIATGFYEELFFRVLVFSLIWDYFRNKIHDVLKSVLLSSLFFGLINFINLFKIQSYAIVIQVLFAIGIGLLFQSILLRFKNILLIIGLHALINYFGMYKYYLGFPSGNAEIGSQSFLNSV